LSVNLNVVSARVRTALVTGSSGGIGRALCERLRADGLRVISLDISGDCDIRIDLRSDPLPDDTLAEVDVCVSNAAITDTIAPAHRMTDQQWRTDIDVNLTGAFRAIQACLPGMRERRWGRIIAISSGAARLGLSGQAAYAASKAGLHGLIRTLAIESREHGITANCVLPGLVAPPAVLKMPQGVLDRVLAGLPMGRMATPAEVAALVGFLASEDAGYITAQEISIDGGLGLNPVSLGSAK
jgi:NAD(P)-dependent dehydrogenase (short-subunit alcohol dehydrogenase family)